jgi:hypothetical protein
VSCATNFGVLGYESRDQLALLAMERKEPLAFLDTQSQCLKSRNSKIVHLTYLRMPIVRAQLKAKDAKSLGHL